MKQADWYFDVISPFAYFALPRVEALAQTVTVRYRPVLFAGLLKHWGQKGPAEIPGKREWTFRWCTWWAQRHGIPFRMPAAHPFNPIAYLRLALLAGGEPAAVRTIFEALWTSAADPADPQRVLELCRQLGVDPARLEAPSIKDALRAQTDAAIARGVFGVPTLDLDGQLFWGADAMDFAEDFLAAPGLLDSPEMRRIAALPVAASRRVD